MVFWYRSDMPSERSTQAYIRFGKPDAMRYAGYNDTCSRPPTDLGGALGCLVFQQRHSGVMMAQPRAACTILTVKDMEIWR